MHPTPCLSPEYRCGKSTLLKALTTRLAKPRDLRGDVRYSGLSVPEVAAAGIHLGQLVQYVNQLDEHFPFLTVRETLSFVAENSLAGADAAAVQARVQDVLDLLHLNGTRRVRGFCLCASTLAQCGAPAGCANTMIGNDLLRGVSGGEKKRVTVGEGLITNARFLALDEISTGARSHGGGDPSARAVQRT